SGNRDDVVVGKLLDHALHQRGPGASALAGRHEVELPRDVHRRLTREAWHLAEAIERQAMTDRTRRRLAIATAGNQKLALRKAAGRGIGEETRLRITQFDPLGALGNFDDPGADRLSAACRQRHAPRAQEIGLGHRVRFDDAGPALYWKRSEIVSRSLHLVR